MTIQTLVARDVRQSRASLPQVLSLRGGQCPGSNKIEGDNMQPAVFADCELDLALAKDSPSGSAIMSLRSFWEGLAQWST